MTNILLFWNTSVYIFYYFFFLIDIGAKAQKKQNYRETTLEWVIPEASAWKAREIQLGKASKIWKPDCKWWPNLARPSAQKFASRNWWTIWTSPKLSLRFRIAIIKGLQTWAWLKLFWQSWTAHKESTSRITFWAPSFWASFKPNSM